MRSDFFAHRAVTIDVMPARIDRPAVQDIAPVRRVTPVQTVMRDLPSPQPDRDLPRQGQKAQVGYGTVGQWDDNAPKVQGFDVWV